MKHYLLFFVLLILCNFSPAQNVGIGTIAPSEKLDVNGNVNINGTIKANGIDGAPGQFITKNNNGSIEWKSIGADDDDSLVIFLATSQGAVQSFTIPAGVTQIIIEAWGGGGAGGTATGLLTAGSAGGGGGGYAKAYFPVTPGENINIVVGLGATGSAAASGSAVSVGSTTITALPGTNSSVAAGLGIDVFSPGRGGLFSVNNNSFRTFIFSKGADGEAVIYKAFPFLTASNSVAYANDFTWGKGGNAGNTMNTGGTGGQSISGDQIFGIFLTYHSSTGTSGGLPGGGGGGDKQRVNNGGDGLVIVHY